MNRIESVNSPYRFNQLNSKCIQTDEIDLITFQYSKRANLLMKEFKKSNKSNYGHVQTI